MLTIVFVAATVTVAPEPLPVAVWHLSGKGGISQNELDSLSGLLTSELQRRAGRKVVAEADLKAMLDLHSAKQDCGVDDDSCLADIGAALGVGEIVTGDVGRVGDYLVLNLRRSDVHLASASRHASRQVRGDVSALVEVLPAAVAELLGLGASATPARRSVAAYWWLAAAGGAAVLVGAAAAIPTKTAHDDYVAARGAGTAGSNHSTWSAVSLTGLGVGGAALAGALVWGLASSSPPRVSVLPSPTGLVIAGAL